MMDTRQAVARAVRMAIWVELGGADKKALRQAADAAIAAHLKALADAGYAVVPREPTEAMREAGNRVNSEWTEIEGDAEVQLPGSPMIWRAMIAASPGGGI